MLRRNFRTRRALIGFACGIVAAIANYYYATGRYHCLESGRVEEMRCTVFRNDGDRHSFLMGQQTIDALDQASHAPGDIAVLQGLLADENAIVAKTAAEVLQRRGAEGHAALQDAFAKAEAAHDIGHARLISEYGGLKPENKQPETKTGK